jgi:hypothetical protein
MHLFLRTALLPTVWPYPVGSISFLISAQQLSFLYIWSELFQTTKIQSDPQVEICYMVNFRISRVKNSGPSLRHFRNTRDSNSADSLNQRTNKNILISGLEKV